MQRLTRFLLQQETTFLGKLRNVGAGFAIMCLWTFFITVFHSKLYDGFQFIQPPSNAYIFFITVLLAPLWEEAVFRYFPISLARKLGVNELLVPFMVLSSIIFGLGHGSPFNILLQGIMGFMFSCIYVKNGYSYWSTFTLHALWNFMCIIGFAQLAN
jgi:membrane protease YdiL (CAAX protease family)